MFGLGGGCIWRGAVCPRGDRWVPLRAGRRAHVRRFSQDAAGNCTVAEARVDEALVRHGGEAVTAAEVREALTNSKGDPLVFLAELRRLVLARLARNPRNVLYTLLNAWYFRREDAAAVAQTMVGAMRAHFNAVVHLFRPSYYKEIVTAKTLLGYVDRKVLPNGNGRTNQSEADCKRKVERLLADTKTAATVRPCALRDFRPSAHNARFDQSQLDPASDGVCVCGVWCRCSILSPTLRPVRRTRRTVSTTRAGRSSTACARRRPAPATLPWLRRCGPMHACMRVCTHTM